jgi:transcriptional regulator with GAF, ATPase, and Fis domain
VRTQEPGVIVSQPDWAALNLIGRSPAFMESLTLLQQCAVTDATVLLCGETGTGKDLAARALHYLSERRGGPFVPINCGALPDSILEGELFGHTRGAYTDAKTGSRGVIGLAQGGTLFLDEIDSLSLRAQAAILRFVQDRSYRPLGSTRIEHADLRLVTATNADLDALAHDGRFRQDLLYRIDVLSVLMPPLRHRDGDAVLLAQAFVQRLVCQYHTGPRVLTRASIEQLHESLPWPGNVRELEHRVHRAFLLAKGEAIDLQLRPPAAAAPTAAAATFAAAKAKAIREFERRYVRDMLERAGGNVSLAARLAGKERSRFGRLVRKYGLQPATPGLLAGE